MLVLLVGQRVAASRGRTVRRRPALVTDPTATEGRAKMTRNLPPLWCPLPPARHPDWVRLDHDAVDFVREQGLYDSDDQLWRLASTRVGDLVARVSPNGHHPVLQMVADFYLWLFAFDDAYCDEGALSNDPGGLCLETSRILRAAEVPMCTGSNRYADALANISRRLDSTATGVQHARWREALRSYFHFQSWEAEYRRRRETPPLEEYVVARLQSGAVKVCFTLLDIADGYELPADEFETPLMRALIETACAVIDWDNDIASYTKEAQRGHDTINLRDIFVQEYDLDGDGALSEALRMRDHVLARFLQLSAAYTGTSEYTRRYIRSLGHWIRGNLDWQNSTKRYGTTHPIVGQRTLPVTGPLRIESIAWWWDDALTR